jgi:cytoskeletal protein RodZ
MAAAWVAALVLATVLTWQIVGLADSQVGDVPVAAAPSLPVASSTSTSEVTSTTRAPESTSTSTASTTVTTGTTAPSSTSPSAPASTDAAAEWSVRTVNSAGGTVIIRHRPGVVELQAATPASGFSVEVDDSGPTRVRVEFESDDADIRVEARWQDGELEVTVED